MPRPITLAVAVSLVTQSFTSHVSLTPSYGAHAGHDFSTVLELPLAPDSLWTSKVILTLPNGVLGAEAEELPGWTATTTELQVSEAPEELLAGRSGKVLVFQATDASAAPTLRFSLKFRIGCDFASPVDATTWLGQRTLWLRSAQYFSKAGSLAPGATHHRLWSRLPESSEAMWQPSEQEAGPCPYLFVSPNEACAGVAQEGDAEASGMSWLGSAVPIPPELAAGEDAAARLSKLVQESLNTEETLETRIESSKNTHAVDRHGRVGGRHRPDGIMDDDEDLSDDLGTPVGTDIEHHINSRDGLILVKLVFFMFIAMVTLGGAYALIAKTIFWATRKLFPSVRYQQPEDAVKGLQKLSLSRGTSPPQTSRENASEAAADVEAGAEAARPDIVGARISWEMAGAAEKCGAALPAWQVVHLGASD